MQVSDYINWWEANKETGLEDVKETFLGLFPNADFLPSIYHPILYKYLKNPQIKHWDNDIFSFSKDKIEEIESRIGKDVMSSTLLSNFHLLAYAYESILDIEERIMLMNRFKGSEELKAKIFSINIYNDLLNTAFSNILKLFIEFQSVIEGKNLIQKNLTPQIECLAKRGFLTITDLADSNIRNAISHGGVKASGTKMVFSYRRGAQHLEQESTVYEFKDLLLQLYDGVSAIILSWFSYLCEENITYNEVYQNPSVHEDTSLFFEKLSMSTLLTACDKVYQLDINNNTEKRQHVNVEFTGVDLDIDSRVFLGLYTAERVFQLRNLSLEDTIMVLFHSPRVANSFFTVNGSVINDLANGVIDLGEAWKRVIKDKNVLMFPINDETRNEFEDSFRYYPDIETEDYRITEIEDISIDDKKRFKAVIYLMRAKRPNHVKKAVEEIINQLKVLENYGFSSNKVKHGNMEADIIYMVFYKKELRRGKDRALFPKNDNFIAQVQYDVEMKFPIRNGFVDPHLKLRREKTIEYNWNPNF
ncbi:hypothetical protein KM914_16750 [Virgibacillus pantothenticus]|uniref:hypothetical protein n=1 Tax=Virgibacillus pantothenticus TaxID=1473 RepID=UPI001C244AF2|nr:hypothetical protein [Virgibacillus pantothenticus]MBU8568047.1 hypothetical protein [Virgibacillus pantothenticus]MBU8601993.1 hypothetical protein [Virgibacillus pantothenticus]MBU8636243.1 hypothetical protein [Virgibacillus pantothenticus]MBU8643763.1 hypothetical protein [Virgibacillus pantothenticus]MBU8648079.1 hypothetical protein [Virgibacillus pantothenticus]